MLTYKMKKEVIKSFHFSKGLIEDSKSYPGIAKGLDEGEITSGDLEEFIEELKDYLIDSIR